MYSVVLMTALLSGGDAPSHHGGGCHGCHGGCYGGCYGGYGYGGCHGCYGGGYGYGYGGCHGCYGGGYGYGYGGCGGYYGCCGGGGWGGSPYGVIPTPPGMPVKPAEMAPPPKAKEGGMARLTIEVPADAKLFIDDQPMQTTSSKRTFNTPALQNGVTYYYMVKAELVVDGKTHTETKQVLVRANEASQLTFPELIALKNGNGKPSGVASAAR